MRSGAPSAAEPGRSPRSKRIPTWVVVSTALAVIVVNIGEILYFGHTKRLLWVGDSDKKFWDYLELLIVPAAIAIGVTLLNWMQSERAREAEDAKEARELEMQAEQWKRELEVEKQQAQDEALQAYLDQISQLLTDKERPLRRARPGDNLSALARARTLTTLTRLDGSRKRSVLQFLYESGLVIRDDVVVDLKGADLSDAHLSAANLSAVNLSEAAMSGAYMNAADLHGADLSEADLNEADLSAATLHEASLTGADLLKADLSAANLHKANLSEAELVRAYLTGANLHEADLTAGDLRSANLLRANLHEAVLSGVDLSGANLREANLHGANLSNANLREANLDGANLREASLSGASLRSALGIANEKLWQQACTLEGATMPNGQKYEEWLKTYTEGRGKDGENHGLS